MGNRESVFLECGLPLAALRLPFWCSTQCDSSHFATKSIANPVYPCYIGCDVQHSQLRSPHLPARPPVAFAQRLPALAQEAASPRLQAGHPGSKHNISNRKTYEKLEVHVTASKSATSLFLIARKQHFAQGTVFASRAKRSISFHRQASAGEAFLSLRSLASYNPKWLLCASRNCANPAPL